jgi:hypothetical protein
MMKILETLAASEGWVTAAELSEKAGASERTVSGDLGTLKKKWGPYLRLETSTKGGVRARNRSVAVMGEIFMQLFRGSTALQWLEDIFFEPEHGIEFYEAKLFTSRSTLNRLLPKVNAFLGKRGMAVRRADGRYRISAEDEQYLRQFYAGFLIELHGLDLKRHQVGLDPKIPGRMIRRILERNLEPYELSFTAGDHIAIAYYIMFYIVSLVRENQGYTISSSYRAEREVSGGDLQYLRGIFPNISEANLRPIHQFIAGQYNGWRSGAEKALVAREADAFFQRIFRAEKASPSATALRLMRFILSCLYLNAKSRPFQTSMLFDRIRYFSAALKRHNVFAYKLAAKNLAVFSERIHFDMSPKLNDLLFWMCQIDPEFGRLAPPKTVLVVSDFGTRHADFLAESLSALLRPDSTDRIGLVTACYPDLPVSPAAEPYDLVITTVPHLPVPHKKMILVNDYPSDENLLDICKALYR